MLTRFFTLEQVMVSATRFATAPRWVACLILAALALFVVAQVPLTPAAAAAATAAAHPVADQSDATLFRATVADMRHGADFYAASVNEQRARNYPVWPPQCIREPTEALLLWLLPNEAAARVVLVALGLVAAEAMRRALARAVLTPREALWGAGIVLIGVADALAPPATVLHEVWASDFLLLSLALRRDDRWLAAVIAGVVACLFRELALPYLCLMTLLAAWERRWREAANWCAGCALFAALYVIHLSLAAAQHHAGDPTSPGWIALGGIPFIIATARSNALFVMAPAWVIAAGLGLSAIGYVGARDRLIGRCGATLALYAGLFMVAGRSDNGYWGFLYAPLLPLGLVLAPRALSDLAARFNRARQRPAAVAAPG
ncbi:MAG TPA: hypothetical protein VGL58_14825 [Caulobacteraceae bacterium]|jgi:hypothetical protein